MRVFLSNLCILSRKPIMLKDHLFRLTLSIISRIVLTKKYVSDESKNKTSIVRPEEFQEMLDELFLLNAVFNIGDWIPWLDFLDLQGYVKRMKGLRKKFDRFLDHVFDEHKAKKEGGNDFMPKDTVDLLLQLADDPNIDVKLTYDCIKALTQDLIAGGTDTSATVLEWAMDIRPKTNIFKYINPIIHLQLSPPSLRNCHQMEFSTSCALLVLASLAALAFLSKLLPFKSHQLKFPPGPKPWPIIGNLNLIGSHPPQSLHKLAQKYGPIMKLKFGSFPVVVASSPQMAKEFLKTHDNVFASRPKTAAGKYTAYNYHNITWSPYGPYWRQSRKIFLSELFSSKQLESYQYIRVEEMRAFLSRLCILSGKPVMLKDHLFRLTLSIISRIALSKKYVSDESNYKTSIVRPEEFQEMLDELFLLNAVFNIGDWIPWLDFLDLQGYVKRMKGLRKKFDRFLDHIFDERKAKKDGRNDFMPKDTVDLLLQLADDPNIDVKLTYDCIKALTQDLIAGGTDTSATVMEWAMGHCRDGFAYFKSWCNDK
ncbi:hypothetical protein CMV_030394 [Castanea mollissima]|uniref:Uncharacterized protein n=1 Tax=Castanea mollissima TaxID=60419 RepID=A0A8J4Q7H1_9ROSI|nr:hypothetical protein CMV_030394 [Castanea mollissima]